MADYEDTSEQPIGGLSGPEVKMSPPKGGGMTLQGKIALDPTQTESILANMQKLIDERNSPMNQWLETMKDAAAWTGGGTEGPSRTLALRDVQRQARQKEIFDMQQQMAAYRAAQAEQERFEKSKQKFLGVGGGNAPQPGSPEFDELPGEVRAALSEARNRDEFNKIWNEYSLKLADKKAGFRYSPESYKKSVEILVPDGKGGYEVDMVSPLEAERMERAGKGVRTQPAQPTQTAPAAQPTATTQPSLTPANIKQVESGGKQGLVSPAGAIGVMQTMPNTLKDPGFGVKPAQNDSPEELERVGVDYFKAMQNKYGNDTYAAIAYNMGPGKTDTWIKNGANFNKLPKETQDYIGKVYIANAQAGKKEGAPELTAAPAETTAAPTTTATAQQVSTGAKPTLSRAKAEMEIEKAGRTEESQARAKDFALRANELESASSNANNTIASAKYVNGLLDKHSKVFGVLEKPTVAAALGSVLEKGFTATGSSVAMSGLSDAIRKAMPGATQQDIDAVQKVARELAKLKLIESRNYLKGQGAVSDHERSLIAELTGNVSSSPAAIRDFMRWGTMRAEFDKEVGGMWREFQRQNPGASFQKFALTKDFETAKDRYDQKLLSFGESTSAEKKPAPMSGTTPNKITWKVVQ